MASLFDPLGLICPVITLAKIFYQELWKLKVDWDDPLDEGLRDKWHNYQSQLSLLKEISISRFVMVDGGYSHLEVHAFSDASEKAYGSCVYIRCKYPNGEVSSRLLCAKSRLAPTKTITIARLELLAAMLMTELVSRLKLEVLEGVKVNKYYYWTDSLITLCWINAEPNNWNIFVSHRVAKIQQATSTDVWRHVPGNSNPADIISRGMLPIDIAKSKFWFDGPEFLLDDESTWPTTRTPELSADSIEEKRKIRSVLTAHIIEDLTSTMHFSRGFRGTRRAFVYVLRFIKNCRFKTIDKTTRMSHLSLVASDFYSIIPVPTMADEEQAELSFIKNIQKSVFAQEYALLFKNNPVPKNSKLANLSPFLDNSGLMRVGGRLKNANIPYSSKHQIILPRDHKFTTLLIHFFHYFRTFHAGPHIILTGIRARYWPINGLVKVRSIINKCTQCFRMRPKFLNQIMGNLPENRLNFTNTRPFVISGVDFAGHFIVHHHIRCRAPRKVYVALFICFATKAIHLELAMDLTTETFIRCLKRFISDRGMVKKVYSDNATNFKGVANELKQIRDMLIRDRDIIRKECDELFVEWSFIPPKAPNFGGLWEASIKITKRLLLNIIGCTEVSTDEMYTIVRQVAAIVNSRPITPISSDANDLEPLTPGHFLYGGVPAALPELPVEEENINRVKMYQRNCWMFQQFWKRFRSEYFTSLQPRTKWLAKRTNISIGTMVLVKDDALPPLKWSLGRVVDVKPDADGDVRVVAIKTSRGIFDRAISSVAVLPIDDADKSQIVEQSQTDQGGEDV